MPKIVERGACPQEGIGRPDHTPAVAASKPVVVENQEKWTLLITRRAVDGNALAPGSETIVIAAADLGNVNGWQLNMGGGVITCDTSCIQKVVMAHTPGIIGDYRYDMRGDIVFGPLSSTIINPDENLIIILYNNDSEDRDFSISLVGTLERVS